MHRNRTILGLVVLFLLQVCLCTGLAADSQSDRPKVLILGDSISIGYTDKVTQLLADMADVARPKREDGRPANCGPTSSGLTNIDKWLGDTQWDVIHFNWGLHDLCYRHKDSKASGHRDKINGKVSVKPEQYEINLRKLVTRLRSTGAKLIWASTTPVPEGTIGRFAGDELTYNAIAAKVMSENGIKINDLHAYMLPKVKTYWQEPGNVHYTEEGSAFLAAKVARAIEDALKPAKNSPAYDASVPKPTASGVSYGEHERHILDFWKAESNRPTPLVFVIHGGGWVGGTKERLHRFADVQPLLNAGISVVAINYRLIRHANEAGIQPPVKAPLHDAARALQFVRSKADVWNIDKERIGAAGGSAGACSSLWLAYHDDLADLNSKDPVARESTRLWCAAVTGPQTTLDPKQMKAWTPNSKYGGHAFGKKTFAEFLAERDSILPLIAEYSPYALVSADDPSVYLFYNSPPALGQHQKDPTHTSNFGVKLQERCTAVGIGCEVEYPGAVGVKHKTPTDYLIATLKGSVKSDVKQTVNNKRPNILFIMSDDHAYQAISVWR
ncbi:alpha/beta hydrolase fold domain-containing protein [Planctomycetota bacterium]